MRRSQTPRCRRARTSATNAVFAGTPAEDDADGPLPAIPPAELEIEHPVVAAAHRPQADALVQREGTGLVLGVDAQADAAKAT